MLQDFEIAGVRSPEVVLHVDEGDFHLIKMEWLNAVALRDIKFFDTPLPESYDHDDFFKCLDEYIRKLHKGSRKEYRPPLFHNDLHLGSIMIDLPTGKPRVIDFGKMTRVGYTAKDDDLKNLYAAEKAMYNLIQQN